MANGQLGVIGNNVQLATGLVPSASVTKDRQYYGPMVSTPGTSTPPNWDSYMDWGVVQGFALAGASGLVKDRLTAIPAWFSRSGTINKINFLCHTNIGAPAKLVLAIYGQNLDGEMYPGLRLAQSTEITVDTGGGGSALVTWTADYHVNAGTLLWLVISVGDNNISPDVGVPCTNMPGLMGTVGIGGVTFNSATDWDLACGIRIASTYAPVAPSPFPLTSPFLYGANQPAGLTIMPVLGYRYVKD